MDIGDINQELLDGLTIADKSEILSRLKRNLKIQQIIYDDEKKKYTNDYER